MKIKDILTETQILADLNVASKEAALSAFAQAMAQTVQSESAEAIFNALLQREHLGSTGVGEGVAIPHAKIPSLKQLTAAFARIPKGIPFDALDQQPVHLMFVLLVPENSAGIHLKALARVSRLMKDPDFRETLLQAPNAATMYQAFLDADEQH